MRQLPPLSGLQAFEAAARLLSFTEAAKELNCTQAAVSQRVRALEAYLSRKLFVRKSNGLQLSEAGEAYFPSVAEALNVAAAATEGLRGRRVPRTVTVSAPVSFLTLWLAPRLDALLAEHPNVELRLNSAIWTDPNAELADIVVEVREQAEIDNGMARLPRERLMLVGAPSLADTLSTTPLEVALKSCRKILIQGRHNLWQRWSQGVAIDLQGDFAPLKVDNAVTALEAAAKGLGVTVAYSTYCAPYLAAGSLVTTTAATLQTELCHVLAGSPNQRPWHPAHKVFGFLRDEFQRTGAGAHNPETRLIPSRNDARAAGTASR
jgi:LysR family glycine cleavage system transcriptional activator